MTPRADLCHNKCFFGPLLLKKGLHNQFNGGLNRSLVKSDGKHADKAFPSYVRAAATRPGTVSSGCAHRLAAKRPLPLKEGDRCVAASLLCV